MKRKYGNPEYTVDTLYSIISTDKMELPNISLKTIGVILEKALGIEDIKRIGESIFASEAKEADAYEIQLYSNYDNYAARLWTAQCRWVKEDVEIKYRPFVYMRQDGGLDWKFQQILLTGEAYYSNEVFKDPRLLLLGYNKIYKILLKLFYQLSFTYEEMTEESDFYLSVIKKKHVIIQCSKRMFEYGQPRDDKLGAFLENYKDFAGILEMIYLTALHYKELGARFDYYIGYLFSNGSHAIQEISRHKLKWFEVYHISLDNKGEISDEVITKEIPGFAQTIPVLPAAIKVWFKMQYEMNDSGDLLFTGNTNLFDGAHLLVSVHSSLGSV